VDRPLSTRRAWLQMAASITAAGALPCRAARALGRTPVSGTLRVVVPWPLARLDPHDIHDAAASLFAHAVFDTLYVEGGSGEPYAALAADPPTQEGEHIIVRLREGLVTARGEPFDAHDAVFSLERARSAGAAAWWVDLPTPAVHPRDARAMRFAHTDPARLARALASPLFAMVPRSFSPERPDGTGAMTAELSAGKMTLVRNPNAARGASFLDSVAVEQAGDLAGSLRAFESNLSDVGWLGAGLHAPRPFAVAFDAGRAAFITLHTGKEAGIWSAPGTAQRLLQGIPPERLARFALGPTAPPSSSAGWGARPCELLFAEGAAYLDELAHTVAALISRPGHEITPRPLPALEIARRRATSTYSLLLGVVRPFDSSDLGVLTALTAADDPQRAIDAFKKPPRLSRLEPWVIARTLRLGVLGELRVMGAHTPEVHLARLPGGGGWDLASSYMGPA
jgi:peptide/nickel transport system substrate-binding protein